VPNSLDKPALRLSLGEVALPENRKRKVLDIELISGTSDARDDAGTSMYGTNCARFYKCNSPTIEFA